MNKGVELCGLSRIYVPRAAPQPKGATEGIGRKLLSAVFYQRGALRVKDFRRIEMRSFIYLTLALSLMAFGSAAQNNQPSANKVERKINRDPDAAQIITSDIDNFWRAYGAAKPDYCFGVFQREYFDKGSPGLSAFKRARIKALILAVTLYALTRDVDRDLALLTMACRVVEGVLNATAAVAMLGLLSIALESAAASGPDAAASNALGAFLLRFQGWNTTVSAPVFAAGSTLYSCLFLRARSIPVLIAWFGIFSSALLVMAGPLEGLGLIKGAVGRFAWLPLLFEVTLALWLITKGVSAPATR